MTTTTRGGFRRSQTPLHKNVIFVSLMALTTAFMLMSVVLYSRIKDLEDDDLITGSGRRYFQNLRKHHHNHKHGHHGKKHGGSQPAKAKLNADLVELYQGKEPQDAIAKFDKDRNEEKQQRRRQGISTLRESYEEEKLDPDDWKRINKAVQALRQPDIPTTSSSVLPYDIHDCPLTPPVDYPYSWNVMTVLENWNPDNVELELAPQTIYQGVCNFDWNKEGDREKAIIYRRQELPFVLQNLPELLRASERWSTPGYVEELLGDEALFTEHSRTNHFMFWKTKNPAVKQQKQQLPEQKQEQKESPPEFVPPTDTTELTFPQWLEKAQHLETSRRHAREEHWYLRINAMLHNHACLYEELPFFDPSLGTSLTMVTPEEHRGINCRFGMKGTTSEAHYDSYNNFIAMIGGRRR